MQDFSNAAGFKWQLQDCQARLCMSESQKGLIGIPAEVWNAACGVSPVVWSQIPLARKHAMYVASI